MTGALHGVRVLDFSRVLAGPYCTMMLADMGAEVIKIEQPGRGDDTRAWGPPHEGTESSYFLAVNRNKRGIALDLKSEVGHQIVLDLVRQADVVVENFRVGVMERLGLGYDDLRAVNPGVIYCSISGFGRSGPYADHAGYDLIVEAMSGFMSVTGESDGTGMRAGVPIGDVTAGMMACNMIVAALLHRERTGQGQLVEASLLDTMIGLLINANLHALMTGENPPRTGNADAFVVPNQVFPTADRPIVITAGNDRLFGTLCHAISHPELAIDARYRTNAARVMHREALVEIIEDALATRTADAWLQILHDAGVPAAPLNTIPEVFVDPHVRARNMLIEVEHATMGTLALPGVPMRFSETAATVRSAPPVLAQHTHEVLSTLCGMSDEAISRLADEGVVEVWAGQAAAG